MSLSSDRPLSQAFRYAVHRHRAATPTDKLRSAVAYGIFAAQFEPALQHRMNAVYASALTGDFIEDRRTRGKQLW